MYLQNKFFYERQKNMKKIIAMLLLAAVVLSFAACAGEDDGKAGGTDGAKTTTPAVTTTRDPGPPPVTDPSTEFYNDFWIVYGSADIDGVKGSEWDNAIPFNVDISIKDNPSPATVVTAYVMWDETSLYFFFEIIDADISQDKGVGDYNNDGIYLYISETADETASDMGTYNNGNYQFALINDELSDVPRRGDRDLSADEDYELKFLTTDNGYNIEFKYTPKNTTLEANHLMFLEIQYNDCSNGSRLGVYKWYGTSDGEAAMRNFAWVALLAQGADIPD